MVEIVASDSSSAAFSDSLATIVTYVLQAIGRGS
jgi:hypothetical protein